MLPDAGPEIVADSKELKDLLNDVYPKIDSLEFVLKQNLVDARTWNPRVAGALLFADEPDAYIPRKCGVKVIRYETVEDDPERDNLKQVIDINGPIYQRICLAVKTTTEVMSSVSVWTTEGLKKMEYPPEAVWEIITNAIIHRDYSVSDDVKILIFDDRIEVRSPGRLPAHITVENILKERFTRNPKIVRTLSRYRNPPNKDIGEGLNTAFQKMQEWKLKKPEISTGANEVIVVLPHSPLARPEELVMEFLDKNAEISNKQAREITGIRS